MEHPRRAAQTSPESPSGENPTERKANEYAKEQTHQSKNQGPS